MTLDTLLALSAVTCSQAMRSPEIREHYAKFNAIHTAPLAGSDFLGMLDNGRALDFCEILPGALSQPRGSKATELGLTQALSVYHATELPEKCTHLEF